jgi:hypothetical protein
MIQVHHAIVGNKKTLWFDKKKKFAGRTAHLHPPLQSPYVELRSIKSETTENALVCALVGVLVGCC